MKFKFYCDAGHGWLAVKRDFLTKLGILNKITGYSYQRGKTVYLEENCDATTFVNEMKNQNIEYDIVHPSNWPDRSPIRSYENFQMTTQELSDLFKNNS